MLTLTVSESLTLIRLGRKYQKCTTQRKTGISPNLASVKKHAEETLLFSVSYQFSLHTSNEILHRPKTLPIREQPKHVLSPLIGYLCSNVSFDWSI